MRLVLLMMCVALTACEKPAVVMVGKPAVATEKVSCTHPGFCYSCLGFSGKPSCGFKYSPVCSGTQDGLVETTPVVLHYLSEPSETWTEQRKRVLSVSGACS